MLRPGYTFMKKWVLGKKLGEGGCAEVFSVSDKNGATTSDLVIKCATLPTGKGKAYKERLRIVNTLYYENMLHKGVLLGFKYAPMIPKNGYGDENGFRFLVMQQLDFDLKTLAEKGTDISGQVLCSIGTQILEGLEIIHKKGYVYVDVKPDNFMILKAQRNAKGSICVTPQDRLYFIDFGLMEKYTEYMSGGAQRAAADRGGIAGTPNYASLDVHAGTSPACKDDIESLGYVLLAIASRGNLPWFCATSDAEGLVMKRNADIVQLASSCGFPQQARSIAYADTPNYGAFRAILQQIASSGGAALPKSKKKSSSTHAPPLVDMNTGKINKRKASSSADATYDVENVINVDVADEVPVKKPSNAKAASKKTAAAKETTTSSRHEVIDCDNTTSSNSSATAKPKKMSTRPMGKSQARNREVSLKTPLLPSHSEIDMEEDSEEEEGSPTPKKETRKKIKVTPPPGPFTAELSSPLRSSQPALPRRSSRLSESPTSSKKAKVGNVATPSIVLKDTTTNRTVTVATDHAVLLGRDNDAAVCFDDGYVSESHAHVQTIVGRNAALRLRVMDLKSSNGTKVNNKKITPKRWHTAAVGDVITLGMTNLVVDCQTLDA